ncbi:MAG: heme-binding protein [Pyrinomonadaceae bacterium]
MTSPVKWSADNRTRVMLFALNLNLLPGETAADVVAYAEDGAHRTFPLVVEHVGAVPQQAWMSSVVVRLNDELANAGDVLVRISYHGVASNRVRFAIGHMGGGPADDPNSVPTPGTAAAAVLAAIPTVPAANPSASTAGNLTAEDVRTIIAQAVSAAASMNRNVTVAVTDREANVLGVFTMLNAPSTTQLRGGNGPGQQPSSITGLVPVGLDGTRVPSVLAAVSKAATASIFSTSGNAFTTRTASFIIQEHFPPGIDFQGSGPLYGVQFSSLRCSDIKTPGLPLGLSGDPGGAPLYKNGQAVGGIGIEGDGVYTVDRDPKDFDQPFEEVISVSGQRGYEPPALIRGDNILVNGLRLPYTNVGDAPNPPTIAFANLPGQVNALNPIRGAQPSQFVPATLGGLPGEVDPRFFPAIGSPTNSPNSLTADDVTRILAQGAQQANVTRAAIRQPLGSSARVTVSVVDTDGRVLGIFRTADAPVFGYDVAVQKARTAAFFTRSNTAALLRNAGFGSYVDRAAADGLRLDGSVAFSDRAIGFLSRPFFPDGINGTPPGPFSPPINEWSVFNVGLQLDLIKTNFEATVVGVNVRCTSIPNLPNGIQIFPGSVPLFKNNVFVGAIGISGDGVDQDDLIAAGGSNGFVAPASVRSDQVIVRGVRLPYVKFPRDPNLP